MLRDARRQRALRLWRALLARLSERLSTPGVAPRLRALVLRQAVSLRVWLSLVPIMAGVALEDVAVRLRRLCQRFGRELHGGCLPSSLAFTSRAERHGYDSTVRDVVSREDVEQLLRATVDRAAVVEINGVQLRLARISRRQEGFHFRRHAVHADVFHDRKNRSLLFLFLFSRFLFFFLTPSSS